MACCALKKQKRQWLITTLTLFLLTSIVAGLTLLCLGLGALFSPRLRSRQEKAINFFRQLLRGLKDKMLDAPFLFSANVRCELSGRLMSISPAIAGFFYRYFNLIVFTFLSIFLFIWLFIFRII
jgi:hypothetical protein